MTEILNLPLLTFSVTIGNNEDWTDSWAYIDAASAPSSLAGLTLVMMVRSIADDPTVLVVAASFSGPVNGLPQNGSISSGGGGLNIVVLAIPKTAVATLAPGSYVFEVQANGDGLTRTIAGGPLTVVQGVVR